MGLTMEELEKRALAKTRRTKTYLKEHYGLSRRLGFCAAEAVILQSHKREVIIGLAIERGLIKDSSDPKAL